MHHVVVVDVVATSYIDPFMTFVTENRTFGQLLSKDYNIRLDLFQQFLAAQP